MEPGPLLFSLLPAADSTLPAVIEGAEDGFREIIETEFKAVFK